MVPVVHAESRHALVIGNSAYKNARALVNPRNDATAVATKLRSVGFAVTERMDADNKGMKDALRQFTSLIPEGGVCLIYYAGHGVQIKGQNYLVPVDANMSAEYEVPDETLPMDTVVRALEQAKSSLNIFVLDCCRDDPFARSWRGTRSASGVGGLQVPADMPQGMFVAFSTSPGKTAEDGDGKNSPYTTALLEELGQPGLDFEKVFKNVGAKVVKVTNGTQEPWFNSKFYGSFSFVISNGTPPSETPITPTVTPQVTSVLAPPPVNAPSQPASGFMGTNRWTLRQPEPLSNSPSPPASGFYDLAEIFNGTSYDAYNDYSKRQIILEAQQKLRNSGHLKSSADGSPGRMTYEAIVGFQRDQRILETGSLDSTTIKSLGLMDRKESSPPPARIDTPRSNRTNNAPKPKPAAKEKSNDNFFRDT